MSKDQAQTLEEAKAAEVMRSLRTASWALPRFAKLGDQETGQVIPYRADRLAPQMHSDVVKYYDNTPRDEYGRTYWLNILASRQTGKSLISALGAYPRTAYTPKQLHVCIADKADRANMLHERLNFCHMNWPETIRSKTVSTTARRCLDFENSSKMMVLSAQEESPGIGMSIDSLHCSEVPFWDDAESVLSMIMPAMMGRKNSLIIKESTPATNDSPSSAYWKDEYEAGKRAAGRWLSSFYPFWSSMLTRLPWKPGEKFDNEEIRLLEKYRHLGLTPENLAFRRSVLETDAKLRRQPELFGVWYPFDDVSCWIGARNRVFGQHIIDKLLSQTLVDWNRADEYKVFRAPHPDALYVIGVDPAGWAARDHAAFHVFEVWEEVVEQVAVFASNRLTPENFVSLLINVGIQYNKALIVVESNGVGAGVLSPLLMSGYSNIYHEAPGKPGKSANAKSNEEMMAMLRDDLMDRMTIRDRDTVAQIQSYGDDAMLAISPKAEILSGDPTGKGKRRERHHWDKVSALRMVSVGVRVTPRRVKTPNLERIWKDVPWYERPLEVRAKILQQKDPARRTQPLRMTYRRLGGK